MARGSRFARAGVLASLLGAASWALSDLAFVGVGNPARDALTQANGYRLDNMLQQKQGDMSLDVSEGFWIGEKGFFKSQNAQGLRYRMIPLKDELKNGVETPKLFQLGPIKIRLGELFGGTGNNEKLRELKRKLFQSGLNDPQKEAENDYWLKRYGHKRWYPKYINQSGANNGQFLRGLAAWSGYDPLNEERGKTWKEMDFGKPWIEAKGELRLPGFVSKAQMEKEMASGRLLKDAPKK
eukprot:TRINITY_DN72_c0_g2_i1.p1 TRINITY_DN72_c0_g2~~TRINITY_DN72_c0_g2_i1.p1  ORF type:complete len:259 (-),score=61.46 TRINITY_DN72_c0_g2_i1:77-793(-)